MNMMMNTNIELGTRVKKIKLRRSTVKDTEQKDVTLLRESKTTLQNTACSLDEFEM